LGQVTWVYLSRVGNWEEMLPADVRELIQPHVPAGSVPDYGSTVRAGPFAGFPNYATAQAVYTADEANLLAELTAWVVLEQREVFEQALR
jgi:hypothetical protein